jgi:aminoglycoside phosphotransferase family enzyme/predicted kinase
VDDIRQSGDCQGEVLAFLADPATHGGAPVRRIDTHSATVFLAGDRAFKVKRAVHYSYLDFSTLAQRRAACEAELEINRIFAPGLYLRVIPITREKNGALQLAGRGENVEWAVEMRRFDETRTLDHLADDNAIDLALADKLARAIAATHNRVPVVEGAPWVAALSRYIEANDAAFRADPHLFDPAQTEQLNQDSRLALDRLRPLLAARSAEGMVRRGHGDLHLGNVALIDGNPMLFDAVEFSPLIAAGDVLYDLAFLLMDLVERSLFAAANVVLNRYFAETRRITDLDAIAALPFFMSLRAAIRANVTASRAAVATPPDREEARSSARKYFVLACRLLRPAPPVLVGIGGLSGTGKSRLAAALAPELAPAPGAIVLRSDVERKALAGRREDERLPPEAYAAESTARVYATLVEKALRVVAAGHSAIIDAVFARPQERDALRDAARARGVTFHGLFLTADMATRMVRVGSRRGDASDADGAVARAQERYVLAHNDWRSIDASGAPESTLAQARELVA